MLKSRPLTRPGRSPFFVAALALGAWVGCGSGDTLPTSSSTATTTGSGGGTSSGTTIGSAGSTTGSGGSGGSAGGTGGTGGAECPTAPPFDLDAPGMEQCLEPLLIGVGNRSRRIVSFDGTNWLYDQLDSGNVVNGQMLDDSALSAAFGKGYIVTASDFGIFTSADRGQTWTKAPAPAPQQWGQGVHVSPVVFNGSRFIVFNDTVSFTSEDGVTWTKHALGDLPGDHLAFHGYAVGTKGRIVSSGGQPTVNLTDDGVVWSSVDTGLAGGFSSIAHGNGVFVGVGDGARAYSTDNGSSWTVVKDSCGANDPVKCVGKYPSQVLFRQGTFVFTTSGNSSAVLQSANGKDWSSVGAGFGFDWSHAFFNGTNYAVHGGDKYWSGPTAGGPWATHPWTTNQDMPVQVFVSGRVLKRAN